MSAIDQRRNPQRGQAANTVNDSVVNTVAPSVETVYRLPYSTYQKLEQEALQGVSVREETTPVQSGYFNGIEHVLRLIRKGYTA